MLTIARQAQQTKTSKAFTPSAHSAVWYYAVRRVQ